MSRVLVTGATGFIGRHLAAALLEQGSEVVALVRASSDPSALPVEVSRVVGDLRDGSGLLRAVDRCGADVVVHLASLLKVPWRPDFSTINVEGTRRVAAAAAQSGARLVVVSSLAAGPRAPVSRYGRVKRAAEDAARVCCPDVHVVRPPMVYGPRDAAMLPLFRAAASGWHLCPTRPVRRVSLVSVTDLADFLARLSSEHTGPAGVFYPAHAEAVGWDALGDSLAAACGAPPPRQIFVPRPMMALSAWAAERWGRLRDQPVAFNEDKWAEACAGDWLCDTTSAEALGWRPGALDARLAEAARWYQEAGWLKSVRAAATSGT
ncbi:MAG: nucleoside-diphosphate-sugar epimerase [Myxococcota bacterium]|jgi:nucleoside-diphosphate-sugar epimerase